MLTSDSEALAENKVLILYILDKVNKPINNAIIYAMLIINLSSCKIVDVSTNNPANKNKWQIASKINKPRYINHLFLIGL